MLELDSAIQHLKESLADHTHKWGCEECKEEHIQLLVWLESYKTISESYPEVRKKIDRLEEENMRLLGSTLRIGKRCETLEAENGELKRMLRLAVDDFQNAMLEEKCKVCGLEHCDYDDIYKWRHHDEAMKLLGGAKNAEN
jgi:hypothetical protein